MIIRFLISDTAESQMAKAKAWYELQSPGLGAPFLQTLDETFDSIRTFPRGFPIIRGTLRQAPVKKFPYVIIYQVGRSEVRVLRVIHGRRHPIHRTGGSRKP
ncbi:MAG: type II toxin-antitoxin system RelE/ParE family toxin [Flavobacteriales bacterium]|nr:type II toxin-antitoxin system RelE/ParE family toxin [Flavobacteriales bacterium]MBK6944245.1 type II toxin-antitoxin system RelE/ParE family toxin [Flavobacteriales bacterium]MBK7240445.1 type II toxin-antitoxin system RelE/ParE family toxin [Flavobacteriales bacterium]MBK7295261.1 type II toxin-antitoxin system RelE/ParE family toxin [Flavobacteriales bacterium]MBK9533911.1 type II toxin-antitoxin system RelE/ParE family toxin [Flavobacteriales bacterium]